MGQNKYELPTIRVPNIDPKMVGLLLQGHQINGPPIYRNCRVVAGRNIGTGHFVDQDHCHAPRQRFCVPRLLVIRLVILILHDPIDTLVP